MSNENASLCPLRLGLSIGLVWAFGLVLVVAASMVWPDYGENFIELLGSVYIGFEASFVGLLWGALWGFIDGFIGGALIALVYNTLGKCCPRSRCE